MLNNIFSCKKKKELHTALQKVPNHDGNQSEETSEVDDIITMFDCLSDASGKDSREDGLALRKKSCEPQKLNILEDHASKELKGLPPIRTQSLPPITLGNSLLANQFMGQRQMISRLAHRSQKSKSEHDLFDSIAKSQKLVGQTWKTESNQVLSHKAWISSPSERLLDRPHHETLCRQHFKYITFFKIEVTRFLAIFGYAKSGFLEK